MSSIEASAAAAAATDACDQAEEIIVVDGTDILDAAPKTAIARFDSVRAGLAALEEKFKGYTPDLSTAAGEKEARANRQALVKIRTTTEKVYKDLNAPLLEAQRKARAIQAEIISAAERYEKPIDDAIKAKDAEREAERQRKAEAEAERVKAIRARISAIGSLPVLAVDMDSATIQAVINDLSNAAMTQERFAEFLDEAEELATQVGAKLSEMRNAAAAREAEAARMEEQRAELARQQAEQAERDRLAAERRQREEAELAEQRRQIAEQQAAAAAILRQAEDAAAEAARKREAADAERQAFLKKQQDAFEEEKLAEKQRQERVRQAQAEQHAAFVRDQGALAAAATTPAQEPAVEPVAEVAPEAAAEPASQPSLEDMPDPEFVETNEIADIDVLYAVAERFNLSLADALHRIRIMDLTELDEAVTAAGVTA